MGHNDKPIVLVNVLGGVAEVFESQPGATRVCVIDIDNLKETGEQVELPHGVGFEELVKGLNIDEYVTFVDPA